MLTPATALYWAVTAKVVLVGTLRTPNRTLWAVLGLASALLLAALYVPWAVAVLRFAPLPLHELAAACGLGLLSVLWFEGIKWARRGPSI
ncbi:cation transporting ATPase C-terminal domain-containing protein [Hydrogenophaga sp.]|uniref:cation transporting ATPase C-terminal domain-containing protein n=1 Tax=Hydrogenophaga sp. TaxID=1904254 RepID=UPI0027374C5B|nr:cation transporting ATPase C-terminal domain-containing protein [Hydrogenophaga sp.]MDP3625403.1 cation transporting ATPase C-terminal domain-containing protein [Hydrogenophaga sp.]MDZ4400420.1 cation transporting ATPase C-terminal domain-containing protein [Hydrogenophaga sp.]